MQARLNQFEERLDVYMRGLGDEDLTEAEWENLGLLEPPDPAVWFKGFERKVGDKT